MESAKSLACIRADFGSKLLAEELPDEPNDSRQEKAQQNAGRDRNIDFRLFALDANIAR